MAFHASDQSASAAVCRRARSDRAGPARAQPHRRPRRDRDARRATMSTHRTPHLDRWGVGAGMAHLRRARGSAVSDARSHLREHHVRQARPLRTASPRRLVSTARPKPARLPLRAPATSSRSLAFDHQMHADQTLADAAELGSRGVGSRLARAASTRERAPSGPLVDELADYLPFVREARLTTPLVARAGFAQHLAARTPKITSAARWDNSRSSPGFSLKLSGSYMVLTRSTRWRRT